MRAQAVSSFGTAAAGARSAPIPAGPGDFDSVLAKASGVPSFGQSSVGKWLGTNGAAAAKSAVPAARGSAFDQMIERRTHRPAAATASPAAAKAPKSGTAAPKGGTATGKSISAATTETPSGESSSTTGGRRAAAPAARARTGSAPAPRVGGGSNAQAHARAAAGRSETAPAGGAWVHDDWAFEPPPAPRLGETLPPRPSAAVAPTGAAAPSAGAMALSDYPRPVGDNGRGLHWIPTVHQSNEAVDRFVAEAKDMHASWVVFLNDGANVGDNDYLVKKLVENGIEPIMRVYTPGVSPVGGDLEGMVKHYKAMGVDYYQLLNEPNLTSENGGQTPSVDRYLDAWVPAARRVASAGGLPGFGALSPGGDVDDIQFLRQALDGLKARGATDTLDKGWLSLHNYTGNAPTADLTKDSGFTRFRFYDSIVKEKLGRSLPVVGTEGGTYGAQGPRAVRDAMSYMDHPHEDYFFANSYWVIANGEGGGHDPQWEKHALFRADGTSPLVDALKGMG